MLLTPRKNGLDSLLKEVRLFEAIAVVFSPVVHKKAEGNEEETKEKASEEQIAKTTERTSHSNPAHTKTPERTFQTVPSEINTDR